jgi:hypothetical protein
LPDTPETALVHARRDSLAPTIYPPVAARERLPSLPALAHGTAAFVIEQQTPASSGGDIDVAVTNSRPEPSSL